MEMINIIIMAAIAIAFVIGLFTKWITAEDIKNWAYDGILLAEKYLDTESGAEKLNYVVTKIYNLMPMFCRPFFTIEKITDLVNEVFDTIAVKITDKKTKNVHTVPQIKE